MSPGISNRDSFLQRVGETIRKYAMLKPGEKVLVAVSGGLDSITLMFALKSLGYDLKIAHFDHQTRAGESRTDAEFVQSICRTLGLPYFHGTEPILEEARRSKSSFEACARELRYAFLAATAIQQGIDALATGHQMNDQAETVLMGLLGLSSDFGPGGILPSGPREKVRIIRPLIECTREEIQKWAMAKGISWREDRSNASTRYTRNRVRIDVMPFLERVRPGVTGHLSRFAEMYHCDNTYLDARASRLLQETLYPADTFPKILVLDHKAFRRAPDAVRQHAVKVLAHRLRVRFSHKHLIDSDVFVLTASTGAYFDFGGGVRFYMAKNGIHILPPSLKLPGATVSPFEVAIPGTTKFGEWAIRTKMISSKDISVAALPGLSSAWRQYFNLDTLNLPIKLRSRKPGDRIVPFGMEQSKKVQDVMIEYGIPEYYRNALPVLTAQEDILWVMGCRRASLAPIGDTTRKVLEISCEYSEREGD